VFCLASDVEGWPNVVHEALSCGTPVVVTRVGAVPEMVPSDHLGRIVPVQDQPALVDALQHALLHVWNRDAIARWGRLRGWDRVADEVYAELRLAQRKH
jgi:teichuronic acid biosynthesis glycosyltransferase TuaC